MKIPKARKLPSGSWFIQLRLGGASYSITEPTEKKCIQKAQLLKASYMADRDVSKKMDRSIQTLEDLLAEYINAKQAILSPSTVRGYEAIKRTRFQAYMNQAPEKINWQRMVNDESRLCGPKTLRNAWVLVAAAIEHTGREKPKIALPQIVSDEHPYLTAEQIPDFLTAIKGAPFELPALLGLHGLRRSEMMAISWDDVSENTINIRGAAVIGRSGALVRKKENKNRSSRRTVPIMIPRLRELLDSVPNQKRIGPLLTCHPNSIYKAINSACEKAGLPLIGTHGLRHSFASLAHSLGIPEAECMALGGWSDPNTMRKIYLHLDAAAKLKASNAMEKFYKMLTQNANN